MQGNRFHSRVTINNATLLLIQWDLFESISRIIWYICYFEPKHLLWWWLIIEAIELIETSWNASVGVVKETLKYGITVILHWHPLLVLCVNAHNNLRATCTMKTCTCSILFQSGRLGIKYFKRAAQIYLIVKVIV